MEEGDDLVAHITKMTTFAQELRELDEEISRQKYALAILVSLPLSYETSLSARRVEDLEFYVNVLLLRFLFFNSFCAELLGVEVVTKSTDHHPANAELYPVKRSLLRSSSWYVLRLPASETHAS